MTISCRVRRTSAGLSSFLFVAWMIYLLTHGHEEEGVHSLPTFRERDMSRLTMSLSMQAG
jgi:hypothetical protein